MPGPERWLKEKSPGKEECRGEAVDRRLKVSKRERSWRDERAWKCRKPLVQSRDAGCVEADGKELRSSEERKFLDKEELESDLLGSGDG
jgi:hypothetical protein